jgi:hypothetical protein
VEVFATPVDVFRENGQIKQTEVPVRVAFFKTCVNSWKYLVFCQWSSLMAPLPPSTMTDEEITIAVSSEKGMFFYKKEDFLRQISLS